MDHVEFNQADVLSLKPEIKPSKKNSLQNEIFF